LAQLLRDTFPRPTPGTEAAWAPSIGGCSGAGPSA